MGFHADASPACTHGRAGWRPVAGRIEVKTAFKAYLAPLRKINWVVYAKEPFAGPRQVLRYLSRYTHRIAISNRRLLVRRRERRHLQLQGLSDRGARPLQDDDTGD